MRGKITQKLRSPQVLWPIAIAYPLLAHAAVLSGDRRWTLAAVGTLAVLVLGPALLRGSALAWTVLLLGAFYAVRFLSSGAMELALYAPPVLIMAFMSWVFGHTLRSGETPLIEQIVRAFHDPEEMLAPDIFTYARRLTLLWAVLLATLAVTPLRRVTGWSQLISLRRMVGLAAFCYLSLHFLTYVVLDQFFSVRDIVDDVANRPYITVGFASYALLVPLAVTSTKKMVRRLGGKRWVRLHRLVYVAAAGGVLHFLWLVKADARDPTIFGVVLVALLGFRIWMRRERQGRASVSAEASG